MTSISRLFILTKNRMQTYLHFLEIFILGYPYAD